MVNNDSNSGNYSRTFTYHSIVQTALLGLHSSAVANALQAFAMPAMSPTMTEGGIASWKKQEGDTFSAGDVLIEIVRRTPHTF